MTDCDALRTQAARCRRLAYSIGDKLTEDRLLAMACEYERQIDAPPQSQGETRSFAEDAARPA